MRGRQKLVGFLGLLLLGVSFGASAQDSVLDVEVGTHQLLRQTSAVVRVAVGDPAIADVNVINRRELLVTGKTRGITTLLIWPQGGGEPTKMRLRVGPVQDPAKAKSPDPQLANATIDPGRSLSGKLPNLTAHARAHATASADAKTPIVDTSVIDLETQVMTEIKVAEVNRTTAQRFGLNFLKNIPNTTVGIGTPGSITSAQLGARNAAPAIGGSLVPLQNAFNLVIGDATRGILGVLSLLENKGLARTLAEPSLTATSGQTASFLAGGEFPVPVSQGGATAGGITIQFKEFGIRLNLTPTVLARDRISLKVAPEVSDLDFSVGVQVGGTAVPALRVRRTDTTVELGDGESFVISGLVSNSLLTNLDKVPWLGDVPILGAFFKSAQVSRNQRELIMVVTPHLVRPLRKEARLPPIPGQKYDRYDPRFDQLYFQETGDFDNAEFGFSR